MATTWTRPSAPSSRKLNPADVALYEAALHRFEVLLAEHPVAVA